MNDQPLHSSYFDQMYAANPDPWDFAGRWYENRKRAITMASLPRPRFRRAFEPGCSIGLLSELLADRCDELITADISDAAVRSARTRLADRKSVDVQLLQVPEQWPDGWFDLIVVSEIAYYCNESGAELLGRKAAASLTGDGVLVLCHWLHPVADYPLAGDFAQRAVRDASGLRCLGCHEEEDFRLELLVPQNVPSVAAAEGLIKQR